MRQFPGSPSSKGNAGSSKQKYLTSPQQQKPSLHKGRGTGWRYGSMKQSRESSKSHIHLPGTLQQHRAPETVLGWGQSHCGFCCYCIQEGATTRAQLKEGKSCSPATTSRELYTAAHSTSTSPQTREMPAIQAVKGTGWRKRQPARHLQ